MSFGFDCCCGELDCAYGGWPVELVDVSPFSRPIRLMHENRAGAFKFWHEADLSCYVRISDTNYHAFLPGGTTAGYPGYNVFERVAISPIAPYDLECWRDRGDGLLCYYRYGDRTLNSDCGCISQNCSNLKTWNYKIKEIYIKKGTDLCHYFYRNNLAYLTKDSNVKCLSCPASGKIQESVYFVRQDRLPTEYKFQTIRTSTPVCEQNEGYDPCCSDDANTAPLSGAQVITASPLRFIIRDGYAVFCGADATSGWGTGAGELLIGTGSFDLTPASSYLDNVRIKSPVQMYLNADYGTDPRCSAIHYQGIMKIQLNDCCNGIGSFLVDDYGVLSWSRTVNGMGYSPGINPYPQCKQCIGYDGVSATGVQPCVHTMPPGYTGSTEHSIIKTCREDWAYSFPCKTVGFTAI